jgi:hypothetical protein
MSRRKRSAQARATGYEGEATRTPEKITAMLRLLDARPGRGCAQDENRAAMLLIWQEQPVRSILQWREIVMQAELTSRFILRIDEHRHRRDLIGQAPP